jgi:hypothetical protein
VAFDVEQLVAAFDNAGMDNDIKELITSQFSEV